MEGKALRPEDLSRIDEALAEIDAALREVSLADRAEIDTGNARSSLVANQQRLRKIRGVYFPNQ